MKNFLLLPLLLMIFSGPAFSQLCMPDSMFRDSAVGVYPPPLNDLNPNGGITESACIGSQYAYTMTIKVPTSLMFNSIPLLIDSIVAHPDDAITGLPVGMHYTCNPPSCVFDPSVDSLGCLLLRGNASDVNTPGDYPLVLSVQIFNNSVFNPLPLTFPNEVIMGADGTYTLVLEPAGSTNCLVGINEIFQENFSISQSPNPFSYFTTLTVDSELDEQLDFIVYDMLGKSVHSETVRIYEGRNSVEFDGSDLAEGVYIYTFGNKEGIASGKMTINR